MKRRAGYDDAKEKEKQETQGAIGAFIFGIIGIVITIAWVFDLIETSIFMSYYHY